MLNAKDVAEDKYPATTLSQMLVVTRIKELHMEASEMSREAVYHQKELKKLAQRAGEVKVVVDELLKLLDDMPDESVPTECRVS